ncbi:serine/threonine-protein kinase [Streptomyces niger]|uniref:serine/threonine-protein kinase n=1 Tax=Streptomyces niger TaxID=66373 RepID=UPI000699D155|nr:serine/threonine-protein kinase [Streptomyces niger]
MGESRLIHGRYRLIDLIGRGGMGEVWRARDESLGRRVAVKCLKPLGQQQDASFMRVLRERFRREARVAAGLQHRGITVVHDFGEDDGILYIVMELLDGRNLSQLLEDNRRNPLPVPDFADIADQVSAALAYTHEQAVVHRDLKPANIVRIADGTVKICDFGIARLGHDIGFTARLTGTGVAMGTPHYMSPEQIAGGTIDHRSDLYSLGCVLYELATGAPPFEFDDAWAVLVGHRDTAPEPLRKRRPDLPEAYERIVLDLLAKDPDDRPRDAAELGKRIATARAPQQTAAGLPAWTAGMRIGAGARPVHTLRTPPRGAVGELTGSWTVGFDLRGPDSVPPARGRPTPSPAVLAALAGRHNAGLSLGRLGRWEEAGEAHRAVAAEREHVLGPDHADTLASRFEVAFTLARSGRFADALREYETVAAGRERTLGAEHADTLAARQETAYVLGRLGRHFEAHQVYTSVLAARDRTMGADHPDTLRCRHNLAYNLSRLGRLEDSYEMAREVAAARARVLGERHPETLVTRHEVAYTLGRLGRWPEALRTYREVAAARSQALGPDHPDTLAATYEVGISLGRLGRSAEALELYRGLVAARTEAQGPEDPETLRARHGLGVNLGRLGRWEEALAEAREVCALREKALGPDHPDTLVSRREVAVGLGWLKRWDEALSVYRQVAEARERVLGPDHSDALASRTDEAHCLEQLGREAEAVGLYRRVAALRQHRGTQGG